MRFFANYASFFLTQVIFYSFSAIDMMFLGHFDPLIMGGVGQGALLYAVILSFTSGPSNIFMTRVMGTKSSNENGFTAGELAGAGMLSVILSLVLTALVVIASLSFSLFRLPAVTSEVAVRYGILLATGSSVMILGKMLLFFHRAQGAKALPILVVAVGALLNAVLDWVALRPEVIAHLRPEFGVGIATIFAEASILVILLFTLKKSRSSVAAAAKPLLGSAGELLAKGFAVGVRNLNDWLLSFILAIAVAKYGELAIVANQASDQIIVFLYRFIQAGCSTMFLLQVSGLADVRAGKLAPAAYLAVLHRQTLAMGGFAVVLALGGFALMAPLLTLFGIGPGEPAYPVAVTILSVHLACLLPYTLQHVFSSLLDGHLQAEKQGWASTLVSYLIVAPLGFVVWHAGLPVFWVWIADGIGMALLAARYFVLWKGDRSLEVQRAA